MGACVPVCVWLDAKGNGESSFKQYDLFCAEGAAGAVNLDEALQSCSSRGGEIILEKDVHYDFPDFIYYDTINKDTTLVVSEGVTLTIGKKGLRMNGTLQLRGGTVDLEKSEGIL